MAEVPAAPMEVQSAEVRESRPWRGSPFRRTSFRLALLLTLVGAGMWGYSLATRPDQAAQAASNAAAAIGSLVHGESPAPAAPRFIDESAPALFRLGLSFLVGFVLAWMLRRVITYTLMIAGLLATGIYFGRKLGWIDLDWAGIENHIDHGVEVARTEAVRAKDVILGYMPSGAAGVFGLWRGAKKS